MEGTKNILFRYFKQLRNSIKPSDRNLMNKRILENMLKLIDYSIIKKLNIHIYLSTSQDVNTNLFINHIFNNHKSIQLYVPKINNNKNNNNKNNIKIYKLTKDTPIKVDLYGYKYPIANVIRRNINFDIVFVPLVISDQRGYRIAWDNGYYNKLFDNYRNNQKMVKIGLSFFEPIKKIINVTNKDYKLDVLVTPTQIHYYK